MCDYYWRRELVFGIILGLAIRLAILAPLIQRSPSLMEIELPQLHLPQLYGSKT